MERLKPKQLKPLVASTVREQWIGGLLQSPTSHPPKNLKPKVPPASPKRFPPKIKSASPKRMKPRNRK